MVYTKITYFLNNNFCMTCGVGLFSPTIEYKLSSQERLQPPVKLFSQLSYMVLRNGLFSIFIPYTDLEPCHKYKFHSCQLC